MNIPTNRATAALHRGRLASTNPTSLLPILSLRDSLSSLNIPRLINGWKGLTKLYVKPKGPSLSLRRTLNLARQFTLVTPSVILDTRTVQLQLNSLPTRPLLLDSMNLHANNSGKHTRVVIVLWPLELLDPILVVSALTPLMLG